MDSSSFSKVFASVAMQLGDSRCFRKHINLSATITVTLSKCRLKKIPTAALSEVRADEYIPGYLKKNRVSNGLNFFLLVLNRTQLPRPPAPETAQKWETVLDS